MALLLWLAVLAAAAPALGAGPRLQALKAAAVAQIGAVNSFLSTPVEAARAAELRDAVDAVVETAGACAQAALVLDGLLPGPAGFLEGRLRGADSMDGRSQTLEPDQRRSAARLGEARARAEALQRAAEEESDPARRKKLKARLARALPALARAERSQAALAPALTDAVEAREEAKTRCRRAARSLEEYSALSAQLQRFPAAMQEPAAVLKARIDLLGQEPEALNRTRFFQAVDPLLDLARGLYARANTAHDAFGRAQADYSRAAGTAAAFDKALDAATKRQAAADAAVAALEAALD